jgi:cytochrome P450
MLGRSQEEAAEWISWGTHIFKELDEFGNNHAVAVDAYINNLVDDAIASPGDDFFGRLAKTELDGRPLSRQEMLGYAGIVFAGGRDTVIHAVTNAIYFLATHSEDMQRLRLNPALISTAVEEFLRFYTPVTHLGRVVNGGAHLRGHDLADDSVVSLCFASANRDSRVFERADECLIDRMPNRHVAFGHGVHRCLGAPLAKTVVSAAIRGFVSLVGNVEVIEAPPKMEDYGSVRRQVSYERLVLELDR